MNHFLLHSSFYSILSSLSSLHIHLKAEEWTDKIEMNHKIFHDKPLQCIFYQPVHMKEKLLIYQPKLLHISQRLGPIQIWPAEHNYPVGQVREPPQDRSSHCSGSCSSNCVSHLPRFWIWFVCPQVLPLSH